LSASTQRRAGIIVICSGKLSQIAYFDPFHTSSKVLTCANNFWASQCVPGHCCRKRLGIIYVCQQKVSSLSIFSGTLLQLLCDFHDFVLKTLQKLPTSLRIGTQTEGPQAANVGFKNFNVGFGNSCTYGCGCKVFVWGNIENHLES
jgi:hypothetical protein